VTASKTCPTCGAAYPDTERFCPKDGTALRAQNGASTDLVGSIIADRYHILKRLGAGGMGRIYLAEHVKMGRRCAIKVLHPSMAADAEAIARFNREAANASRIDHPNVAAIYDFGETSDGLLYIAMQLIEGQTLGDILKTSGALTPWRTTDIIRQAAEGLYAAHAMGIIHRDLKPDNIMVTSGPDGVDSVKVVDFGIAKGTGEAARGVTKTGIVMGTPEYMSPEQLAGEEVDGRSDLYSLGLVAFSMLAGELPFPAASTRTSVIMRLTEQPRSLAQVRSGVPWPNELEAVLRRALDREPSHRFPSTREFAHALQAAVAMMPMHSVELTGTRNFVAASADTVPQNVTTARRPASSPKPVVTSRRPTWAIAGALAFLLLAGVAAASRGAIKRAHARSALQQGISAYREGRNEVAKERFVTAADEAPNDPMPHVYLSRLARETNDLSTATAEGVKAVRLGPENATALRELATTLYATQNYSGARAFYVRAIRIDPADHTSQGYLGCSLIQLGRGEEGLRWIQRAGTGTWSACVTAAQH
jgi:serine/threonine protein kinase/Flp pilus assembly protein TadD